MEEHGDDISTIEEKRERSKIEDEQMMQPTKETGNETITEEPAEEEAEAQADPHTSHGEGVGNETLTEQNTQSEHGSNETDESRNPEIGPVTRHCHKSNYLMCIEPHKSFDSIFHIPWKLNDKDKDVYDTSNVFLASKCRI